MVRPGRLPLPCGRHGGGTGGVRPDAHGGPGVPFGALPPRHHALSPGPARGGVVALPGMPRADAGVRDGALPHGRGAVPARPRRRGPPPARALPRIPPLRRARPQPPLAPSVYLR
ncbi:MAG: hypothetical protein MUE73_15985 [Planctomycetes bacterium]|nr:hypothetical protein [Planctomycetota bacterium]